MSRMRRPCAISIHALFLLALLAAAPGVVFAQGGSVGIPENAHAKSYESEWECDQGYREVKGTRSAGEEFADLALFTETRGGAEVVAKRSREIAAREPARSAAE